MPPPRVDLFGAPLAGTGPWSPRTRDRAVAVTFLLLAVAVFVLITPFLDALLFAAATVVVTWPAYAWIHRRTRHPAVAATLTSVSIALLVLAPLSLLAVWLLEETIEFVDAVVAASNSGALQQKAEAVIRSLGPLQEQIRARTGWQLDPWTLVAPVQRALVNAGQGIANTVPQWVGSIFVAGLDGLVYLFAVVSLYMEGPRILRGLSWLSPMHEEHDRRLFDVFREFSTNLVYGALTTAVVQGLVASIGYAVAGVPNLVLLSLLTTVFGFVPFVGTAMIWVPVSAWALAERGWKWGLFLLAWNMAITGSIDNVLRPLLVRGRSPIHPLPIFLSVLGGISWMGLPGALVGPVCVAMLLALYEIWREQAGQPESADP